MRKNVEKEPDEREGTYKFLVRNRLNRWEPWTGCFKTKDDAMLWFHNHGQFHIDNGHVLGFFLKEELLEVFGEKTFPC